MRQATAFGDTLVLNRTITVPLGGATLGIEDTVSNQGPDPVDWMLLYHVNIGWPLLSPDTVIDIPGTAASGAASGHFTVGEPRETFEEVSSQYVLDRVDDTVSVVNSALGLSLHLQYSTRTLPWLNTWKMLHRRRYVFALEPSNTRSLAGRVEARKTGDLPFLNPGDTKTMRLRITVTDL